MTACCAEHEAAVAESLALVRRSEREVLIAARNEERAGRRMIEADLANRPTLQAWDIQTIARRRLVDRRRDLRLARERFVRESRLYAYHLQGVVGNAQEAANER